MKDSIIDSGQPLSTIRWHPSSLVVNYLKAQAAACLTTSTSSSSNDFKLGNE
jgi:hypothetical protein